MSLSRRRADLNPKLHMDRQPAIARITDPSLPAGKRREIDNVMKKARANTNDYWDKKLIEVEEKDPNRWRHTGYKKMYIQGESSSESEREVGGGSYNRYNSSTGGPPPSMSGRYRRSRSHSHSRSRSGLRKSPPSPVMRRRSPPIGGGGGGMDGGHGRRGMSPPSSLENSSRGRLPRSPIQRSSPQRMGRGGGVTRPRSPPEPPMRRRTSRSPLNRRRSPPPGAGGMSSNNRRRSPPPMSNAASVSNKRGQILPRSKRPPSPPPRNALRSRSNSSVTSCTDDSCSMCSNHHHHRSRSASLHARARNGPRSPPPKSRVMHYRTGPQEMPPTADRHVSSRVHGRPTSPPPRSLDVKYREEKLRRATRERSAGGTVSEAHSKVRPARHSPPEDPRLKNRPPEPPEPAASSVAPTAIPTKKKKKDKELRTRIKIEGEKRKKHSSSESEDSAGSDSDNSLPTFTATTRLTLSERFGKMAQWSIDRSNMENMRITKDSTGGALKVMIEEGLDSPPPPPRRYSYSPAPAGHFPEELATTAPSGMLSWDDVRVRYEYYKSRGYLRDLDLKDYVKWEEWWYRYQDWLKHERYYDYWERQQMQRRRRKKLPISQRLN